MTGLFEPLTTYIASKRLLTAVLTQVNLITSRTTYQPPHLYFVTTLPSKTQRYCDVRWPDCLNHWPHTLHPNGFSPLCWRRWTWSPSSEQHTSTIQTSLISNWAADLLKKLIERLKILVAHNHYMHKKNATATDDIDILHILDIWTTFASFM